MSDLYEFSLTVATTLLLFFAVFFLAARVPDRKRYSAYVRSSRLMGAALMLLSANYLIHLFVELRFLYRAAAVLMNMATYFIVYRLFTYAFLELLDRNRTTRSVTRRRAVCHFGSWGIYLLSCAALCFVHGTAQKIGISVLAIILFAYGIFLAVDLFRTYNRVVRQCDETHSDDIASYIRWMSILTWWAVIYGVGCSLFTFLPDRWIFLWVLSSVPFYIYIFVSYTNYLLYFDTAESILESSDESVLPDDAGSPESEVTEEDSPSYFFDIKKNMDRWIDSQGYTKQGLTIEDLSDALGTNRTYLSSYIRSTYGLSFREWVTTLRIEYAKNLMTDHPEYTIAAISESAGFISLSYFTRIFKEKEGTTPGKWLKDMRR